MYMYMYMYIIYIYVYTCVCIDMFNIHCRQDVWLWMDIYICIHTPDT